MGSFARPIAGTAGSGANDCMRRRPTRGEKGRDHGRHHRSGVHLEERGDDPLGRGHHAYLVPLAALRLRRVRGHPLLPESRERQEPCVPPARPHGAPAPQLQDRLHRAALHGGRAVRRHAGAHPQEQPAVVLHPPARVPRLRRDGRRSHRLAHRRGHCRVAVGELPGRRRAGERRGRGRVLVAPALEQRHPSRGEEHGVLHELHLGEARGQGAWLRRGHHAERGRPCVRGHRREPVHRARRRAVHAAPVRRPAGGHHARHGALSGRRPGDPRYRGEPHP